MSDTPKPFSVPVEDLHARKEFENVRLTRDLLRMLRHAGWLEVTEDTILAAFPPIRQPDIEAYFISTKAPATMDRFAAWCERNGVTYREHPDPRRRSMVLTVERS